VSRAQDVHKDADPTISAIGLARASRVPDSSSLSHGRFIDELGPPQTRELDGFSGLAHRHTLKRDSGPFRRASLQCRTRVPPCPCGQRSIQHFVQMTSVCPLALDLMRMRRDGRPRVPTVIGHAMRCESRSWLRVWVVRGWTHAGVYESKLPRASVLDEARDRAMDGRMSREKLAHWFGALAWSVSARLGRADRSARTTGAHRGASRGTDSGCSFFGSRWSRHL
jgi:hypothetical protein